MQLTRKGATNGIPIWLLGVTVGLVIFRVALLAGHSSQVALKFVDWRPHSELQTDAKLQTKPVLLYYVGETTPKTKMMDDNVFSNRMVAACILKNYFPVIVPGTSNLESEDRKIVKKLYKKYMVVQVPSLVVTTPVGSEVAHLNGFKPSAQVYQFLRTVVDSEKLKEVREEDRAPKKKKGSASEGVEENKDEPTSADAIKSIKSRSLLRF